MESLQHGEEIQDYINEQLRSRNIVAQAIVVRADNDANFEVRICGAIPGIYFNLENEAVGLSAGARQKIAAFLDSLPARSVGAGDGKVSA